MGQHLTQFGVNAQSRFEGQEIRRLSRFLSVGLVSSLAYVGTMVLAVDTLHVPVVAASVAAFVVGTAASYGGNTLWTFEAQVEWRNFAVFLAVTIVGLGLSTLVAWALNTANVHYLLISLANLLIVPVWNFLGHAYWTYR